VALVCDHAGWAAAANPSSTKARGEATRKKEGAMTHPEWGNCWLAPVSVCMSGLPVRGWDGKKEDCGIFWHAGMM